MAKINWLEQFATDQLEKMKKTASINKLAEQIIVDRSAFPNVKVGSLVDYNNYKYTVVDTEYMDKSGPGLLLEKFAENIQSPTETGEVSTVNGNVAATSTTSTTSEDEAECGGDCFGTGVAKTAAKTDDDDFEELDLPDNDDDAEDLTTEADEDIPDSYNEYPSTLNRPGGVKPMPSADIEGPGKKNVTDAPYHPTYDPGEKFAMDIPDTFQEAADRTAEIIRQEDAQDRTTVDGHYTWNQNIILDKIVNDVVSPSSPASDNDEDVDELADFDDSATDETDNNEDVDELADFDDSATDTDDDEIADDDVDIDNDDDNDVDEAVDSMLDDDTDDNDDFSSSNNFADADNNEDEDFDIDNEDFEFDDNDNNDNEDNIDDSSSTEDDFDFDSTDEDSIEEKKEASSKNKFLSRLARKQ